MKFTIDADKFKKVITLGTRLCGSNLTLPILNNALVSLKKDVLTISSTNLEIGLSVSSHVKPEREGSITTPGKILFDFVSSLPKGEVKIEEKETTLHVKTKGFQAKILGQDPKEFPILPQVQEKKFIEMNGLEFIDGITKVNHVVSPSDTRAEISGVLMKTEKNILTLVGTDSIRLGEKKIKTSQALEKKTVIIPQRTAAELSYVLSGLDGNIKIFLDPSQAGFELTPKDPLEPQIKLISRLIEGTYPEYQGIIPSKIKTQAILDKEEFQRKIKVASLFSSRIQDIKLKIEPPKAVLISSSSAEIGEVNSKINGKVEGELIEIVFNWRYLLDGLMALDSSEVSFGVNDTTSPAILKPIGDKTYLYVLMPKTI